MKRWPIVLGAAVIVMAAAPTFADHENDKGDAQCGYAHKKGRHYGLYRDNPNDPTQWPSQGDPANPSVGSTSPTGAVYAGRFGGSEGNAQYSVGACGIGTTEAAVYQSGGQTHLVVVGDGGNQNPAGTGYQGVNTGYGGKDGRANKGGALCVGQKNGASQCTTQSTPVMCENSNPGKQVDWHDTAKDGCDLRQ